MLVHACACLHSACLRACMRVCSGVSVLVRAARVHEVDGLPFQAVEATTLASRVGGIQACPIVLEPIAVTHRPVACMRSCQPSMLACACVCSRACACALVRMRVFVRASSEPNSPLQGVAGTRHSVVLRLARGMVSALRIVELVPPSAAAAPLYAICCTTSVCCALLCERQAYACVRQVQQAAVTWAPTEFAARCTAFGVRAVLLHPRDGRVACARCVYP
jgi:hypothetical protein